MGLGTERVMADLDRLASMSAGGPGVTRIAYTAADFEARSWFEAKCREAGLRLEVDRVGNCFGWSAGASEGHQPRILLGSHLDSVIEAGRYDGIVGVVIGMHVVSELVAENPELPIGVASFACEESTRFGFGTVGSRFLMGELRYDDVHALKDRDGETLEHILDRAGLGDGFPKVAESGFISAYLEVHIDQGTLLTSSGHSIGIVDTIAGLSRTSVTWHGEPSHSGGRRRGERRDALLGAARFLAQLDDVWSRAERDAFVTVTVGQLVVEPNSPNTVPGKVDMILDVRALDRDLIDSTVREAVELASTVAADSSLEVETHPIGRLDPVAMDPGLRQVLETTATELGVPHPTIPSFAGHDAMVIAKRFPAAMILVANPTGMSHSPDEGVDEVGMSQAIEVTKASILRMLQ